MDCTPYRELLIEKIYNELPPERVPQLDEHLAACQPCRQVLASMTRTHEFLQEHPLSIPQSAPSVVVARPPQRFRPWLAFAAGLLIATVLVGSGVAIGLSVEGGQDVGPVAASGPGSITSSELDSAMANYANGFDRRLDDYGSQLNTLAARPVSDRSETNSLTREQLEARIRLYQQSRSTGRDREIDYTLQGLTRWQYDANERLDTLQQAVSYILLSKDPRVTEQ